LVARQSPRNVRESHEFEIQITDPCDGNDYRLVVAINYRHQIVFIKWLGTHAEYDEIDVKTVKCGHQAN
jgi:mRNA-degrading endonuclease HigB of HigAB toxin-antitoxin module